MANSKTTNNQQEIIEMFNAISSTYDLLNHLLSFGIDKRWRKSACKKVFSEYQKNELDKIIDVACGTGDMLIEWNKQASKDGIKVKQYMGVDPAIGMLKYAKEKINFANFEEGQATEIPLEDNSCDILSITYGIRNVVELDVAFKEFFRVLKPGGILVILEFAKQQRETLFDKFVRWYLHKMIPILGGLISKNKDAYTYLPESIAGFITKDELSQKLENVNFKKVEVKDFSFKISTMFIFKKPL